MKHLDAIQSILDGQDPLETIGTESLDEQAKTPQEFANNALKVARQKSGKRSVDQEIQLAMNLLKTAITSKSGFDSTAVLSPERKKEVAAMEKGLALLQKDLGSA